MLGHPPVVVTTNLKAPVPRPWNLGGKGGWGLGGGRRGRSAQPGTPGLQTAAPSPGGSAIARSAARARPWRDALCAVAHDGTRGEPCVPLRSPPTGALCVPPSNASPAQFRYYTRLFRQYQCSIYWLPILAGPYAGPARSAIYLNWPPSRPVTVCTS